MNQNAQGTRAVLPAEPLFASSWVALFRLIQAQFTSREPANDADDAPAREQSH